LNGPFRPSVLLRLETVHIDRQFGRRDHVGQKNELPSHQLRAVTKVKIFAKRVVLPSASFLNAGAPPKTRRSVEVEEASASAARRLLEQKMTIQKHCLNPRQQRITAVQMPPTRLDHADLRVGEEMDGALKQIALRDEIGIKNAHKLAISRFQTDFECAGLESGAIDSMNQLNVEAAATQFLGARCGDLAGVIRGIVEDLDLQQILRVIQLPDSPEPALHHINVIKDGQLHRDLRQLFEVAGRHRRPFAVFEEEINDEIPVNTVGRKTDEHGEITGRPNYIAEASLHKVSCQY